MCVSMENMDVRMWYMECFRIIHRDLKCDNIFIDGPTGHTRSLFFFFSHAWTRMMSSFFLLLLHIFIIFVFHLCSMHTDAEEKHKQCTLNNARDSWSVCVLRVCEKLTPQGSLNLARNLARFRFTTIARFRFRYTCFQRVFRIFTSKTCKIRVWKV